MRSRIERKVNPEIFIKSSVSEEDIERELAIKMVKDMPINELHKLMQFSRLDPYNKEDIDKLIAINPYSYEIISILREQKVVLYTVECNLK